MAAVVQYIGDDLVFDWTQLPKQLHSNIELRDKIFSEVKTKYAVVYVDNKVLFEINKYVLDRIKSDLNKEFKNGKSGNK